MPTTPRIKICGLRDAASAHAAIEAGAHAVGLVFVPASPRYADHDAARAVADAAASASDTIVVGVFKDTPLESIRELADRYRLDEAQLHGDYDADAIRSLAPIGAVKALSFDPTDFTADLKAWTHQAQEMDNLRGILVDTPDPTKLGGGTGVTFDWQALRRSIDEVGLTPPIILAGGLNASNVAEAISIVQPWGVDVSSGVESSRGVKDIEKIRAFCTAVRGG